MTVRAAAERYLRLGWPLLLCAANTKRPHHRTPSVYDASRDAGWVLALLDCYPDANLAVHLQPAGVAVVETDSPAGERALAELERGHSAVPPGPVVRTRRGRHLFFENSPGIRGRNLHGTDLVLLASPGQYVVLPPSVVAGHRREWLTQIQDIVLNLPPLPNWLARNPTRQAATVGNLAGSKKSPLASTPTAAQFAIAEARTRLAMRPAHPGTGRGTALFAAACSLGRHVHAGTLTQDQAVDALRQAAAPLRLTPYERDRSIQRGLRLGPERSA